MSTMLSEAHTKAVHDILVEKLAVEEAQLTSEARIQEDLGADSLDVVEILMAVEERFGISIPDEISEKVSTVDDLLEALAEMLEKTDPRLR